MYEKPSSSFVAQFIGENNQLMGKVKSINGETCVVETNTGENIKALKINITGNLNLRGNKINFKKISMNNIYLQK